jgi:flagellar biosynthetic protein FliP
VAFSLQLLLLLAVLSLAVARIIIMTSFLRVAIVFDFVKRALSLQQVPPTQVLMGISLFLTLFIMWPPSIGSTRPRISPFPWGRSLGGGLQENGAAAPSVHVPPDAGRPNNIRLFMRMSNLPKPSTLADVPTHILIPAFILHEMTVAFKIGILLFIPFIIIDMVVASTLMSMA